MFTILIRLVTWPLQAKQIKSTAALQDMQKSKEWQEIQKKHKDDKQALQQEQMKLYQEKGINPLSGSLPLLIQFPVIIGLYQAITRSLAITPFQMVDLSRHVYPFLPISKLLPINNQFLWMDLALPERWYPFGLAVGIPVLAIIELATTFMQSRLMSPPSQPGEQGAQMTQAMNLYMPLFMGYLALTLASGLSLYFITSNVATIGQYAAMGKLNWNNLLPRARNLKGHLLLTTGDVDINVHPAGTLRMADALIKANKRFDLFIFTGQRHGYATMSDYWFWLRSEYFVRHLLGDDRWSANIVELDNEREQTGGAPARQGGPPNN